MCALNPSISLCKILCFVWMTPLKSTYMQVHRRKFTIAQSWASSPLVKVHQIKPCTEEHDCDHVHFSALVTGLERWIYPQGQTV